MIWAAVLVRTEGSQRSFQASIKMPIAPMRSLTEVNVPRRIACRVMMPKKISTMFNHDSLVGVKCRVIRLFLSSQLVTSGCLWVA